MESHNELNRALGRIEGKLDSFHDHMKLISEKVDRHETFISSLKGKIAMVSGVAALGSTLLTSWIKDKFTL